MSPTRLASRWLPAVAALFTSGCALYGSGPTPSKIAALKPVDTAERTAVIREQASDFERDRAAILAMLGEYAVRFHFQETVALAPGYERRPADDSGAFETVVLVEDQPDRIVLQHLLVSERGGKVIKHWRQDWHYQAPSRWEFTEDQTWRIKPLPSDKIEGHWTQCVYEVSDAPRYCGTGRWNHRYGVSTWTSDRTWRPLPRREYKKRQDYNALNVENRHTITPSGWTHEQDNTKVIRKGEHTERTLVREFGFNDYRRIDGFDFSPAYDYWDKTKGFWAEVRAEWARRIADHGGVQLTIPVDGMKIIEPLFEQAERIRQGQPVSQQEVLAVFDAYTAPPLTKLAAKPAALQ